ECSTRYEGVNYSKEGLEELKRRRNETARHGFARKLAGLLLVAQAPVSFYLLWLYYYYSFHGLMSALQKW
ncbi:MAG: hypothetical protein OEZ04_09610, partial [Nitrospinota bacterium]|nr:hypothetical protein [Nitrospinota bacterium]